MLFCEALALHMPTAQEVRPREPAPTEVEAERMAVLEMQKSRVYLLASHRDNHFCVSLRRTSSRQRLSWTTCSA